MFNVKTRKIQLIDSCNAGFHGSSLCVFNNNYLIKIGGYNKGIEGEINNLYAELYDIKNNKWHEITQIEYQNTTAAFKPFRTD